MARRVRGQGGVRFRDGRWEARLQLDQRDRRCASFETEAEAWDWIAELKTKVRQGTAARVVAPLQEPPAPAPALLLFSDLARLYKLHKVKRWRPGSLAFFEGHKGLLLKQFGTKRLTEIRALDLQTFLDDEIGRPCRDREGNPTGKVVQAASVFKYQQVLSQLFNYAVRMDFLAASPMAKVERIRTEAKDQRVLRLPEIQAILAACADDQRPFFTVLAMTGLRRSEIFRMRWDWVDFEGGRLRVKVAKRGSSELPLRPVVRATLQRIKDALLAEDAEALKPNDKGQLPHVFPGRGGKQMTCKAEMLRRLAVRAKVAPGVGLQAFRRGYLSLIERLPGVSYSVVKSLARHTLRSSSDITARYLYPEYEELLAALTVLEQRILTPPNVIPLQRPASGTT